jgi:hypothetical protein
MGISIFERGQEHSGFTLIRDSTSEFDRPRQRRHEVLILTCYVNFDCIKRLIKELRGTIRVTDFFLAFDMSEVFREGPVKVDNKLKEICSWCKDKNINFRVKALSATSLVHAKGYAIIQRCDGQVSDGLTLITSANFTGAGFFGKNVEVGYYSRKKSDVLDFEKMYINLWESYGKDITKEIEADSLYLYKYSLLTSGVFLHKWDGSLSKMVGVKYRLTERGKEQSTFNPELAELGVEPGDTFTRQPIRLDELPRKAIPAAFTKSFTIETHWGRWCPKAIWIELYRHIGQVDNFHTSFASKTTDDILAEACDREKEVQDRLLSLGLIEPVSKDFIKTWREKIISLRENKSKLLRLFTGYEEHELPYDVRSQKDIEALYESIQESIQLAGKKNTIMQKTITSMETQTVAPLKLTKAEKLKIEQMLRES